MPPTREILRLLALVNARRQDDDLLATDRGFGSHEGREAGGPPWEIYLTDPGEYPDPQTWQTEVVQPLA